MISYEKFKQQLDSFGYFNYQWFHFELTDDFEITIYDEEQDEIYGIISIEDEEHSRISLRLPLLSFELADILQVAYYLESLHEGYIPKKQEEKKK